MANEMSPSPGELTFDSPEVQAALGNNPTPAPESDLTFDSPEVQAALGATPAPEAPLTFSSPEVQEALGNTAPDTSPLAAEARGEGHARDLQTDVAAADAKRRELLQRVLNNERIAATVKEMERAGVGGAEIESFKQKEGWVEPSFFGALGDSLTRLGKTESSFPLDVNVAMEGRSEAFSPLTLLGSLVQNAMQLAKGQKRSGITGTDKDVTERVKAILSKPIVDKFGLIDPEAVAVSDLPRYQQNELMLQYAAGRTHVPIEIWRDILGARGGVMADDTNIGVVAKRVARIADEVAFNIPSWKFTKMTLGDKLDKLKEIPNIPIPINIVWDGDTAYANGVGVPDAHKGDAPGELEREGWKAILDAQKGQIESQAMENWQSISSMAVPFGGALKAGGKVIGVGAKAASLASKTGKVLEMLGKPGEVVEGAIRGVTRVSPPLTLKLAELQKTSPALAKGLELSGRAATKVLTPAVAGAIGAPEGQGQAAFVGGILLGGTASLIEPGMAAIYRARDPIKAILRTPEYDNLPSFVKKYVDTHLPEGVDYKEFRSTTLNSIELQKELDKTILKIRAGQLPAETMEVLLEQGSQDPRIRAHLDMLSTGGDPNGKTPIGRANESYMRRLLDDQVSRSSMEKAKLPKQGDAGNSAMLEQKMQSATRAMEDIKQIPNHILNDTQTLIRVLGGEEVGGFKIQGAKFLADSMEGLMSSGSDNLPYRLFMQDVLKVSAASADASSPRRLAELMDLIGNKPDFASHFQAVEKLGRTKDTQVFDTTLNAVSPQVSLSKMLSESGAQEIKNIVNLAINDIGLYTSLQGRRKQIKLNKADLKEIQMQQQEKLQRYRFKSSLDAEYLNRQLDSLAKASNAVDAQLKLSKSLTGGGNGSKLDKLIVYLNDPSLPQNRKQQLQEIIDRVENGGTISKSEIELFPQIRPLMQDVDYLARRQQGIRASMQEALIQRGAVDERIVKSRGLNLQKEALYDNPSNAASVARVGMEEELLGGGAVAGLTDSKYYNNVVGRIAEEIGDSLEKTGVVQISPESVGYLRLLQNRNFVKEVIGFNGWNNAEYKRFVTRVGETADTLYSMSAEGKVWKESIEKLDGMIKSDTASVPGIARNLKQMRQAFRISKMQRELDRKAYQLYDIAERLTDGGQLSKADTKNLVDFMSGSMVQRYRLAADPTWLVTRAEEAENVFNLIKNTTPQILEEMKNTFGEMLGKDRNDLNASIVTSWFIDPQNDFDKSGHLGAALQLAKYYRKGSASPRYVEWLAQLANQELAATVISKDTGYAIATDVSKMAQGKQVGKSRADKLVGSFFDEVSALKVGNKSYVEFQGQKPFTDMIKKNIIGLNGIEGRLVMNEMETELGGLFRKWVKQGQTDDALARIMEEWKMGVNSKDVDNQAIAMERSLKSYWRVQGLNSESLEMGIKYIKLWQKHDKLKVGVWNEVNDRLNAAHSTRVAPLEYQPARLETDASITSRVSFDTSNMDSLRSMDTMFGRQIATNERGQNLKAQMNISLEDLMHPDDLFHSSTQRMMQDLHSREPRRRLWEKGLLMQNAGYGAYATSLTQTFLGGLPTWNFDTHRLINGVINKMPLLRQAKALSPLINPNYYLISFGQAGMNFLQNAQMQALNPYQWNRAFKGLVNSAPGFIKGIWQRAVNPEEFIEAVAAAGHTPSPKYAQVNAELMKGLNPQLSARIQSQMARIDWDASPMWKKIHAGTSSVADPIFERITGTIKENSEAVTYRIVLGQAAGLWEAATTAARAVSDQGEGAMYRAAVGVLEKPLAGVTGSKVDTSHIAMSLIKSIDDKQSMVAYERFATSYAHQAVGRYDPGNVPALFRNMGQVVPGSAQFFNPTTAGIYRLLAAGHGLVTAGGRDAGHVGIAVATVAGLYGLSSLWLAASQTTGISTFNKAVPLVGLAGTPGNSEFSPSVKVGSMKELVMVELLMRTANLARKYATYSQDGTMDTEAVDAEMTKDWQRVVDVALQTSPNVLFPLLRDLLYSPGKVGFAYLAGDDRQLYSELLEMDGNDQLNLKTAPDGTPLAGEENSFMSSMYRLLTALTPRQGERKELYPFTPENVLEYLAKEKAIPLSLLYQLRETRRKEGQHKQDLQDTLMSGEGLGEYRPKKADSVLPVEPEEETPAPEPTYPE